jgi:hypothetical protein
MSPYRLKIVYRTNVCVIAYLALAWFLGRLSWPLAGFVFMYWLLLPFAVVWSWPEDRATPLWGRTFISAMLVGAASAFAFAALAI